jgi:hypothetical protein
MQGVLQTLTESLSLGQGSLTVQLEMLDTLTQLLLSNRGLQLEFFRIQGYTSLTKLMIQAATALTAPPGRKPGPDSDASQAERDSTAQALIDGVLCMVLSLIVDAHPQRLIANTDALAWLLEISCGTAAEEGVAAVPLELTGTMALSPLCASWHLIRHQALLGLQDLVSINPLNAALIKKNGGVAFLLRVLDQVISQ